MKMESSFNNSQRLPDLPEAPALEDILNGKKKAGLVAVKNEPLVQERIDSRGIFFDDNLLLVNHNNMDDQEIGLLTFDCLSIDAVYKTLPLEVILDLRSYAINTSRMNRLRKDCDVYGEEIVYVDVIDKKNNEEILTSGRIISLEKLKEKDVDPDKVIVFRMTKNDQQNYHTEPNWTTDATAFKKMYEKTYDEKIKSNILISTLSKISKNGGIATEQMDTDGCCFHRLSKENLKESDILGKFSYSEFFTGKIKK